MGRLGFAVLLGSFFITCALIQADDGTNQRTLSKQEIQEVYARDGFWPFVRRYLAAKNLEEAKLIWMLRQAHLGLDDAGLEKGRQEIAVVRLWLETERRRRARGESLLHEAATSNAEAVKYVLEDGGDPNARDKKGWTPLHHAAQAGRFKVIEVLVKAGAKVNARGNEGETPLIIAAVNGEREAVGVLLRLGANVQIKTQSGGTALDYAQAGQTQTEGSIQPYEDIIWILRKFEADNTPLQRRAPKKIRSRGSTTIE